MINHIEGRLIEKTPAYAVIDCGGVGYLLNISLNTYAKIGQSEKCKLYAQEMYMRDDLPRLYGFSELAERELFRQLVSVTGVGGTSAIMMLSSLSADEISEAILTGNIAVLKSIKGIGEKTAQRIVIDLKGKIGKNELLLGNLVSSNNTMREEALSALVMLGFVKNTAEKALDRVLKMEAANIISVEQLIKLALKNL